MVTKQCTGQQASLLLPEATEITLILDRMLNRFCEQPTLELYNFFKHDQPIEGEVFSELAELAGLETCSFICDVDYYAEQSPELKAAIASQRLSGRKGKLIRENRSKVDVTLDQAGVSDITDDDMNDPAFMSELALAVINGGFSDLNHYAEDREEYKRALEFCVSNSRKSGSYFWWADIAGVADAQLFREKVLGKMGLGWALRGEAKPAQIQEREQAKKIKEGRAKALRTRMKNKIARSPIVGVLPSRVAVEQPKIVRIHDLVVAAQQQPMQMANIEATRPKLNKIDLGQFMNSSKGIGVTGASGQIDLFKDLDTELSAFSHRTDGAEGQSDTGQLWRSQAKRRQSKATSTQTAFLGVDGSVIPINGPPPGIAQINISHRQPFASG